MSEVREAVKIALKFAHHIYGEEDSPLEVIRVEEIEYDESAGLWLVTLGWNDKDITEHPSTFAQMAGATTKKPRVYKVFHVNLEEGEVKKMEMRS